jgi:hypothetical protein
MGQKLYGIKFVVLNMIDKVVNDSYLHDNCIMINCKQQNLY